MTEQMFVAYCREINLGTGVKKPSAADQLAWIDARIAAHPHGRLVATFTEKEPGCETRKPRAGSANAVAWKDPATNPAARMKRPQLEKAIAECRKNPDAVLLLTEQDTLYTYPWITSAIEEADVPFLTVFQPTERQGHIAPHHASTPGAIIQQWDGDDSATFNGVWEVVERECGQYLAFIRAQRTTMLFRGIPQPHGSAYKATPRTDRRPLDTHPTVQSAVDEWMVARGFQARRANSIMCSPHPKIAENFIHPKNGGPSGAVYAIFPCDGFSYTWCRNEQDVGSLLAPRGDDWTREELDCALWEADIIDGGLEHALRAEHEIMVAGAPYIGIRWKGFRPSIMNKVGFVLRTSAYVEN